MAENEKIIEIGKMYMTEATLKAPRCSKINDTTYMEEYTYCNYLYKNVRKLEQSELNSLGFLSQQYEAYAYEYPKVVWEASQYAKMVENTETIDEIITDMIPNLL